MVNTFMVSLVITLQHIKFLVYLLRPITLSIRWLDHLCYKRTLESGINEERWNVVAFAGYSLANPTIIGGMRTKFTVKSHQQNIFVIKRCLIQYLYHLRQHLLFAFPGQRRAEKPVGYIIYQKIKMSCFRSQY